MDDPKTIPFSFKPEKSGLGRFLGLLEADVMEIIWSAEAMTVKRMVYLLNRGKRRHAYTTIMTVMNRLAVKGLLCREKKGAAYVYSPSVSREDFLEAVIGDIMASLFTDYQDITARSFFKLHKKAKRKAARKAKSGRSDSSK